ncbi:unnamed protein product [Effrenium voratum]|nr:unnamed protein product [Effrenium voratum]
MADAAEQSVPVTHLAGRRLHEAGSCNPCLFFTRKKDGCWRGEACDHCHICSRDEAKIRRNRLTGQARRARRQAEAQEREATKLGAKADPEAGALDS